MSNLQVDRKVNGNTETPPIIERKPAATEKQQEISNLATQQIQTSRPGLPLLSSTIKAKTQSRNIFVRILRCVKATICCFKKDLPEPEPIQVSKDEELAKYLGVDPKDFSVTMQQFKEFIKDKNNVGAKPVDLEEVAELLEKQPAEAAAVVVKDEKHEQEVERLNQIIKNLEKQIEDAEKIALEKDEKHAKNLGELTKKLEKQIEDAERADERHTKEMEELTQSIEALEAQLATANDRAATDKAAAEKATKEKDEQHKEELQKLILSVDKLERELIIAKEQAATDKAEAEKAAQKKEEQHKKESEAAAQEIATLQEANKAMQQKLDEFQKSQQDMMRMMQEMQMQMQMIQQPTVVNAVVEPTNVPPPAPPAAPPPPPPAAKKASTPFLMKKSTPPSPAPSSPAADMGNIAAQIAAKAKNKTPLDLDQVGKAKTNASEKPSNSDDHSAELAAKIKARQARPPLDLNQIGNVNTNASSRSNAPSIADQVAAAATRRISENSSEKEKTNDATPIVASAKTQESTKKALDVVISTLPDTPDVNNLKEQIAEMKKNMSDTALILEQLESLKNTWDSNIVVKRKIEFAIALIKKARDLQIQETSK